jgi:hypothetical protein
MEVETVLDSDLDSLFTGASSRSLRYLLDFL